MSSFKNMDILKLIQEDQDQLCKWLSTDPDHIIKKCGAILTMDQYLELQKQDVPLEKITLLLKMITEGGECKCQSFYDILKEQQTHYPEMQFFKQKGSQSQTVHADGGSAAFARNIKGVKANTLNLSVKITGSPGVTPQSERPAGQLAACNASNNSFASADTLQDVDINGDINMSVEFNNQLPAGPTEPKRMRHEVEGPHGPMKSSLSVEDKRLFFKKNRGDLVSRVKVVKPIVDDLQSEGLHDEMAANVHADKIPQEGMRKLLDSATCSAAVEALFTALLKHENGVMMDLLGKQAPQ